MKKSALKQNQKNGFNSPRSPRSPRRHEYGFNQGYMGGHVKQISKIGEKPVRKRGKVFFPVEIPDFTLDKI